jgi:hypothetical protein
MQITVNRGEHAVTIELDGSSPKLLSLAADTALKLLGDVPATKAKQQIGFAAPPVSE